MRDKARIVRILELLKLIWENEPDQRFGQLLINKGVVPDDPSVWRMEDDILEAELNLMKL